MTLADKLFRELKLIPVNSSGFADHRLKQGWIARVDHHSVDIKYPFGTNSVDPTEDHLLDDGSAIHIANPRQEVYPIHAYPVSAESF